MSWHSEVLVFFGVFAASGLLLTKRSLNALDKRQIEIPWFAWPCFALPLVAFLQWALTKQLPYGGDAVLALFYSALCISCLVLGYSTLSGDHQLDAIAKPFRHPASTLAWLLLLAGIGSTAIAWIQVLLIWNQLDWFVRTDLFRRPGANLAQPNHLALLLVMAMASSLYLYTLKKLQSPFLLFGLIGILATGLAVTESRAGLLAGLIVMLWWFAKQPVILPTLPRWWSVAAAFILVTCFFTWPFVYSAIFITSGADASTRLADGSLRFQVWPQLISAVWLHPWLGWGFMQVAPAHNAVAHAYPVSEAYGFSHSIILDMALWFGLPVALLLMVCMLVWWLNRLLLANQPASWYALAIFMTLGVGAMLEFPHTYAYFLAPVLFLIGVMEREMAKPVWLKINVKVAAVAFSAVSGLMLWSVVEYVRLEEDVRIARFQALNIGQTPEGYQIPNTVLLTQLSTLANNSRIKPQPGMLPAQLEELRNSAVRYPWTSTQYRYSLALALNGQMKEATRQLQVMRLQRGDKLYFQTLEALNLRLAEFNINERMVAPP